jgi:hypothetical protein
MRSISVDEISKAMFTGRSILDAVPELSGEFLLKGVTGIARRDWGAALSNLWIVIEQITSNIWTRRILSSSQESEIIAGRLDQLSDTRTWTAAARQELLYQIGAISSETLSTLSIARKARNALAHRGKHPNEKDAQSAYQSTMSILQSAVADLSIPLKELDLNNHILSDPFLPKEPLQIEPTHWMEIPKLPGEAELERLESQTRTLRPPIS